MLHHPGAFAIWGLERGGYTFARDETGAPIFRCGDPTLGVRWFANGVPASRTDVVESIRAALPGLVLQAMADGDHGLKLLRCSLELTEKHVPEGLAGCLVGLLNMPDETPTPTCRPCRGLNDYR